MARQFPRSSMYEGSAGAVWFGGPDQRAPSIASFFCGDDVELTGRHRLRRDQIPDHILDVADAGGVAIVQVSEDDSRLRPILPSAIRVPLLVDLHADLPGDVETLRAALRTSTTREDLRRIRRAGFEFRITTEPDAVREFHARHYEALVTDRFPDDGTVMPLESMLRGLERGGELLCADVDGEWVAGIFNVEQKAEYSLRSLGIRDADAEIRQRRVSAALIVRSLERAVELGKDRASLGRALPFLGKGPIWFKAKWGGIVTLGPPITYLHMFLDLRHDAVRRMLATTPIIHVLDGQLVASTWLEPGDDALRATVRDAGRFPGISRWFVFSQPETIAVGSTALEECADIEAVPVTTDERHPVWLGGVLQAGAIQA